MIITPIHGLGLLPNLDIIEDIQIATLLGMESVNCIQCFKKTNDYKKKHFQNIKEKYSYVDTEIKMEELEKSLMEAEIITCNNNVYGFNFEKYENYMKIEEIKKEYFEEVNYDKCIVNSQIEQQELEKPKVKKLVR